MSTARIIKATGREWVAGLTWRSFADRPTLAERRQDAKELGAEWVALRNTAQVIQAGFCGVVDERKPRRLYSLAAAIAESQRQPWLGTYKLADDLWWYVAVRDGQAILPDGDVIGSQAAVQEARHRHENFADWNFVEGTLEDLLPILSSSRGPDELVPLRSVEPISPWRIATPIVAAILVSLGGAWLWHRHVEAEQRARLAAIAEERARILAEQKASSPLVSTPTPDRWLAACASVIGSVPIAEQGWTVSAVSCGATAVSIGWKRQPAATVLQRPQGALSSDGNNIDQSIPLGSLRSGHDKARGLQAGDAVLYGLLQPLNIQVRISAPPVPPGLPGAQAGSAAKPPPIPSQSVNFKLPISPFGVDFNQVPGLRLSFLKRTKSGWDIQGMLYGR